MPVYPEYRPLYKISQLLLILTHASRGDKSSLIRLHLFDWTLKDASRRRSLEQSASTGVLEVQVWGIEPSLNFALQFALAENFIERVSTSYLLTQKGKNFLSSFDVDELFADDVVFLKKLGSKITEKMVNQVAERWEAIR